MIFKCKNKYEKKLEELVNLGDEGSGHGGGLGGGFTQREQLNREIQHLQFKIEQRKKICIGLYSGIIAAVVSAITGPIVTYFLKLL